MSETTMTRDAFECWARETFVLDWHPVIGVYTNSHTDAAFQAWCAVKAREATALATVQALRDDALQERDQVTKELEEAKAEVERLKISERLLTNVVECLDVSGVTRVCDRGLPLSPASRVRQLRWERNQQLATARADALREVREKVEKLETHGVLPSAGFGRAFAGVDRDAVLALLGGDA